MVVFLDSSEEFELASALRFAFDAWDVMVYVCTTYGA